MTGADEAPLSETKAINGARVLIISVSYAPETTGIGPYSAAMAEGLAQAGARVTVIAGMPHYPSWRLSDRDRRRMRRDESRNGVSVVRLRQMVPRRHTAFTRLLYDLSFLLHGLVSRRTWHSPDVVIAVSPALGGAIFARFEAWRHGVPLLVVVQDLVAVGASQSGMHGGRIVARLLGLVEGRLLRAADIVGLAHAAFIDECSRMGVDQRAMTVVKNWSLRPVSDVDGVAARPASWAGKYVVMHAGNMGFKQGLEVVAAAARLAHSAGHDDLLFILMGDGNRRAALEPLARGLPTLAIADPVSDADFPAVVAAADALLVTQRKAVVDMSVPSKLTAYFAAGRPVICAAADEGGTAAEVSKSQAGVLVPAEDPQALLEAVLQLRDDPQKSKQLAAAGRNYSRDHLSSEDGLRRVLAMVVAGLGQTSV